jgi:hypothetical protein
VKDAAQLVSPPSGSSGVVGHVVDLAFVSDEKEARLLSWAAGAKPSNSSSSSNSGMQGGGGGGGGGGLMQALVFASLAEAEKYAPRGAAYFPLPPSEGGADDALPLDLPELLSSTRGSRIPGNPRHMVNVLEMESGPHDLRGTVFRAIFKDKIVMDSNYHAEKYLQQLSTEGVRERPTVFTVQEGRCFRGDGFVTPALDTLPPGPLDFVFGQPPGEEKGLRAGEGRCCSRFVYAMP